MIARAFGSHHNGQLFRSSPGPLSTTAHDMHQIALRALSRRFPVVEALYRTVWTCTTFRAMQIDPTIEGREPISDIEIDNPQVDTVYLLPTTRDGDGKRAYLGADAILLKQAVASGVHVRYAVPDEDLEFVEHFSSGVELVTLAVAVVNLIPSTIQGIYALIQLVARRKGIKEENLDKAGVRLKIDYIKTHTTEARGLEISGDSDSVVEIMKRLGRES